MFWNKPMTNTKQTAAKKVVPSAQDRAREYLPFCQNIIEEEIIRDLLEQVEGLESKLEAANKKVSSQGWELLGYSCKVNRLTRYLREANEVCRSASAIAKRDGENTNWGSFKDLLSKVLKKQHNLLYPNKEAKSDE
jgi:hypothetical protein